MKDLTLIQIDFVLLLSRHYPEFTPAEIAELFKALLYSMDRTRLACEHCKWRKETIEVFLQKKKEEKEKYEEKKVGKRPVFTTKGYPNVIRSLEIDQ